MGFNIRDRNFYGGLDAGRALFCIFVVAWHDKILGEYTSLASTDIAGFSPGIKDVVYYNVFLLAVPVFMAISLFLYSVNRNREGYFPGRIRRLAVMYLFWLAVLYSFRGIQASFGQDVLIVRDFDSVKHIIATLAFGGHSHFYFFASLIFVTLLMEGYLRLLKGNERFAPLANTIGLIASLSLFYILPLLDWKYSAFAVNDSNPTNFLPYVFIANILSIRHGRGERLWGLATAGLAAFLAASWVEWRYLDMHRFYLWHSHPGVVPSYSRVSSVFGSLFVVSVLLSMPRAAIPVISRISYLSLGVYCLQVFLPVQGAVYYLVPAASGLSGVHLLIFAAKIGLLLLVASLMKRVRILGGFV